MKKWKERYLTKLGHRRRKKEQERQEKKDRKRAGEHKHYLNVLKYAKEHNIQIKPPKKKNTFQSRKYPKPKKIGNIKFLSGKDNLFSEKSVSINYKKEIIEIPQYFSFTDNYEESFFLLKKLFNVLNSEKVEEIELDYDKCESIDVDASICMDIILAEFINYYQRCEKLGHKVSTKSIMPINFEKEHIKKVLFSIGAYRNLKGWEIKYDDVIALSVLINSQEDPRRWENSEIHQTKIVEYIKECLRRLGLELSSHSETGFYKVLGETMNNAEEHASMPLRFAIGYFQEVKCEDDHYGVFNFSIINFGRTIYDTFKSENCANKKAVDQMSELSAEYTKKGWLKKAEFEEESLWTLYALQEGVTSKEKKRGNGSIQYIENFFKLKGSMDKDDFSKLLLISGNTRIEFDGSYRIIEKEKKNGAKGYKMITFNDSGKINEKPDKKFVKFVPNYFPGTIVSAKILIKHYNTRKIGNGSNCL